MTRVIFTLHNNQEMRLDTNFLNPKRSAPKDVARLKNLYWLASGFLPQFDAASETVICLQDPPPDIDVDKIGYESDNSTFSERSLVLSARYRTTYRSNVTQEARSIVSSIFTDAYEAEPWRTFELREALDRPNSILREMMAFDVMSIRIRVFQDTTSFNYRNKDELKVLRNQTGKSNVHDPQSKWIPYVYKNGIWSFVKRSDRPEVAFQLLTMPWPSWGYLI